MKGIRLVVCVLAVLLLAGLAFLFRTGPERPAADRTGLDSAPAAHARPARLAEETASVPAVKPPSPADGAVTAQDEEPPPTDEERAAAEEEAKVTAFDDLTDKWMEPAKAGVTMKDIDGFRAAFGAVPKDRRDECIHRALNLIPDENVMLLAGVLMDKSMDREIVETVFNDVLNRDEEVKKPILKQIFADKKHPCWADTAWILDVTGELPAKGK